MITRSTIKRIFYSSQFRLFQDIRCELHLQYERFLNCISPTRIKKRSTLRQSQSVKLHWGCGPHHFEGWVNVDGWDSSAVDYIHDLRRTLPFQNESVELIFTEHVLEHFTEQDGQAILQDFYRMLKFGGTARIIVPDFSKFVHNDKDAGEVFVGSSWEGMSHAQATNDLFYNHFHRAIYDGEMLKCALVRAGFAIKNIRATSFRSSRISELNRDAGGVDREDFSVFIDATK